MLGGVIGLRAGDLVFNAMFSGASLVGGGP